MSLLRSGLIVSLTPSLESPWRRPDDVARLAAAAAEGGAVAVKVDGPDAVKAVKALALGIAVLAVNIDDAYGGVVRITPTMRHARELADAGADVIELEADSEKRRRDGQDVFELIGEFTRLGAPVKAGVGNSEDAVGAVRAGAGYVSSSTFGYTAEATKLKLPDIDLVRALVKSVTVPVIAERGYSTPDDVRAALEVGALAVVVGSAIVDPVWLTRRFVRATTGNAQRG